MTMIVCPSRHADPRLAAGPLADGKCPWCRLIVSAHPEASRFDRLPPRRVKADGTLLLREPNGGRSFNPSIIRFHDRWLMAYRTGWQGSRIAVCEIDPINGIPGPSATLDLKHPRCGVGCEDARLFSYGGRLHVSFTAFDGMNTHVLYASLTDTFGVGQVFEPRYQHRRPWEKNWAFFEGADGGLYCVYDIDPVHTVLRIDGERAEIAGQTPSPVVGWVGGHLRGGCPPVLVDGEYWHWFHGCKEDGEPNRLYSVGLYTFDPEPPFAVRRWSKEPVAWASDHDWAASGNYCRVAFPGGAVLDKGRWHVGVGVHDRACEVWSWDHADVRESLGMQRYRGHCFSLGVRTEFRDGCSGWSCEHRCDAGQPVAVPGGVCQTCNQWIPQ